MIVNKTLIQNARAVVSCDDNNTVYQNCDVLIQDSAIVEIGKNISCPEAAVIDGTDKFIYPGLINTHHHFFQTFVRNLLEIDYINMSVPQWLDKIYRIFQHVDEEVIYYSTQVALADLIKHGCTTAFDHQYCYTKASGKKLVDRQMQAAGELGIRYHAGRGANTLPRELGSTIPQDMLETTDEFLQDCQRIIDKFHDGGPFSMGQVVISPCQPINSYQETFVESAKLARKCGVRLHTHLGEGEDPIMVERTGMRTLAWCESIDFVGPDVWIAHGWDLLPEEYPVLAKYGMGVSHCPGPAVLGGFPILPMRAMEEAGVCISLGCDGSATNDSSSLLDTLRTAFLMQAWHAKSRGGNCVTPYDMLKMATVNGAKTLGRSDIGQLAPDKAADLFMIDASRLELAGTLHDPKNLLARVGVTGPVHLTMINGKVVYEKGVLTGVNEENLAKEAEKVCTRVLRDPYPHIWTMG